MDKWDEFDADREWSSTGDSDFLRDAHRKASKVIKDKRQAKGKAKDKANTEQRNG